MGSHGLAGLSTRAAGQVLDTVVQRIVESVQPQQIILFGSAARGATGVDSDLDLLVIMPAPVDRRRTASTIYQALIGVGYAVDLVVATPEDIEHARAQTGSLIRTAFDEGRVVYAA